MLKILNWLLGFTLFNAYWLGLYYLICYPSKKETFRLVDLSKYFKEEQEHEIL